MQIRKPLLTRHRRERLVLWALAMLAWIAAVVTATAPISARQLRQRGDVSIDALSRMIVRLIVIRAGELARMRRRPLRFHKHGRDLRRRQLMRSVIGSRMRRALKRRDVAARIAVLMDALRDIDVFARPLAQRLRRRLTRLFAIAPRPTPAAPLNAAPPFAPALADSS